MKTQLTMQQKQTALVAPALSLLGQIGTMALTFKPMTTLPETAINACKAIFAAASVRPFGQSYLPVSREGSIQSERGNSKRHYDWPQLHPKGETPVAMSHF